MIMKKKKSRYIFCEIVDRNYYFDEAFRLEAMGMIAQQGSSEIDAKTVDQELCTKKYTKNFGFLVEANVIKPRINLQSGVQQILQAIQLARVAVSTP